MTWILGIIWLIMAVVVIWALYHALRSERD